ncbi:MAG: MerR family transcriptional regulator, partial [Bacillota bacterium]
YEKEGLLPHVNRTPGGIRHYTDEDLEWIGLICCLKNTGMSIRQIRDFVTLSLQGPKTLKARCELLKNHHKDVDENISGLQRHLAVVTCKIEHYTRQYEEYRKRSKA